MEQVKNPQEILYNYFKKFKGKYFIFYSKDKEDDREYGICFIRDIKLKGYNDEVFIMSDFYNPKGELSDKGRWSRLSILDFKRLNFFVLTKKEFKKELILRKLR